MAGRWGMPLRRFVAGFAWLIGLLVLIGSPRTLWAGEPLAELLQADRLACAFEQGITAVFPPRGGVRLRPPLDPKRPGLTIAIVDRDKHQAVLEEDRSETPGILVTSSAGLTVFARTPAGNVTMVTVYAQYAGISNNFVMVTSKHAGGTSPNISQRYGVCRVSPAVKSSPTTPAQGPQKQ